MAIAVFLLFTVETSARVVREVRVTKLEENAARAFYAAEAGFNRVRARIIMQATDQQIKVINGVPESLTYTGESNGPQYTVEVVKLSNSPVKWSVTSTGISGSGGPFATKRIVSGSIEVTGTTSVVIDTVTRDVNTVATTYTP